MKPLEVINNPNSSKFMVELAKSISLNVTRDNWQDTATIPFDLIFSDSNQVSPPLIGGDEIFSKHAELILGAQQEVLLQTFAYEAQSYAGKKFLDAIKTLQERHKNNQLESLKKGEILKPIEVCILISKASSFARKFMLMTTGVKSTWKRTKSEYDIGIEFDVDPTILNISVKIVFFGGAGFHSKSLIIDGKQAVITGANFQARNHGPTPWFDLGFSFSGNIANSLRAHFITTWNSTNAQSEHGMKTADLTVNNALSQVVIDQKFLTEENFKEIKQPILITARNVRNLGSEENTQNLAFKIAFTNAKVNIHIITPNLNADLIKDLIINSVKRGIVVNIVLPKYFNDSRQKIIGVGGTNRTTVHELYTRLEQEDHKNLNIKWHVDVDGKRVDGYASILHAKFSVFDKRVCITGSANLDRHSIYHGRELNVVAEDEEIVSEWNDKIFTPIFERAQSVDEQYKDYKKCRADAIGYLQEFINKKIYHFEEKGRIALLQILRASMIKLDFLADKVSIIRKKYKGSNADRISVINRLELFIVNAYNSLIDSSLYDMDQPGTLLNNLEAQINNQGIGLLSLLKALTEEVKRSHQHDGKLSVFFQTRSRLADILESLRSDIDKTPTNSLYPCNINRS